MSTPRYLAALALIVSGAATIAAAGWLVHPALGLLVAGASLVGLGLSVDVSPREAPAAPVEVAGRQGRPAPWARRERLVRPRLTDGTAEQIANAVTGAVRRAPRARQERGGRVA